MRTKTRKPRNSGVVRPQLSTIPLSKLAPSIVTILALCLGITSIRYAIDAKWTIAFSLIFVAALLDGIDGRLARLLNATSGFGAQLDSLADIVSFGVAPAVVMYMWCLHEIPIKGVGWSVVLIFVGSSALRLARFNSALSGSDEKKKHLSQFFVGIPMPAGGLSAMLPMLLSFEVLDKELFSPWLVAAYISIIAMLMVSKVPTFALKTIHIQREYVAMIMMMTTLLFAGILLEPWLILPLINIAYIVAIPLSVMQYKKLNVQA